MKVSKVLQVLNHRVEWLEAKLAGFDDKDCKAWHWVHQEYVAMQEATRIVAAEVAARKPEKANQ